MTQTPTLRAFAPDDQPAARALILEGLGERFGFIDETRNPDVDDIAAHYLTPGHLFLVAELAGVVVGTGALLFEDDGATCQLARVSTRRDLRRQGIARLIVAALLAEARQRGRRRAWVETNETWHEAIALYQRLGFTITERRDGLVFLALRLAE